MSGIFGIFFKNGRPVGKAELARMGESMTEWGQHGSHQFSKGCFGVGIHLEYNTPESILERQPISPGSGNSDVIVADARLDNRRELLGKLEIEKSAGTELPDSALLAKAYLKWGSNFPVHLIGAFAIAVWNDADQTLTLVRDHIGFRPLFVFENAAMLVFASDIRAILSVEGVPEEIDENAVIANRTQRASYLLERSLFKGVTKLRPGCMLSSTPKKTITRAYWHPENAPAVRYQSASDYANQLYQLFEQSVDANVRSYGPVGAHISGGIDSTAICVMANRLMLEDNRKLHGVYTWSPAPELADYPLVDERARIELICKSEDLRCVYNNMTAEMIVEDWMKDVSRLPQANMVEETPTRKLATADGVSVMLSGWGGDQFASFHGKGLYTEKLLKLQLSGLYQEMMISRRIRGSSIKSQVRTQLLYPLLPKFFHRFRPGLVPNRILTATNLSRKSKDSIRQLALEHVAKLTVRANMLTPLRLGSLTFRMDGWSAQGAMDNLEYRYPLLDKRIVEFCLGLPAEQFAQSGWLRYIFRASMQGLLPAEVCWTHRLKSETAKTSFKSDLMSTAESLLSRKHELGHISPYIPSSSPFDGL